MSSTSPAAQSTQDFVPVQEVRDGTILLKDGSVRAVLLISSINFDLKSEDEQRSILMQFQNFLNSLDFSVQICIQSRKLDIRPYLTLLQNREKEQVNDLMRIQVREYIDFIKTFTESTNIMTKSFYAVVSYTPAIVNVKRGFFSNIFGKKTSTMAQQEFEQLQSQLEERVAVVQQGLVRTGVRVLRLGTEETVELLYTLFNPGATEKPVVTPEQTS